MVDIIDISETLATHPTKKNDTRDISIIDMIVVHTTDWDTTPYKLAKYDVTPYFIVDGKKIYNHISKTGCSSITYHEGIMKDGTVYKTLPWEEISWHAGNWNNKSIGIALYYSVKDYPTKRMMDSLIERCADICLFLRLIPDKVVGHRELKGTGWFWSKGSKKLRKTCPGLHVDMERLRYDITKQMQYVMGLKVDGVFGPKSKSALEIW